MSDPMATWNNWVTKRQLSDDEELAFLDFLSAEDHRPEALSAEELDEQYAEFQARSQEPD